MTERSDGGTNARIPACKSYRGEFRKEPREGGWERGDVSRAKGGSLRRVGRAGDQARASAVLTYAGPMTARTTAWCRRAAEARSAQRIFEEG